MTLDKENRVTAAIKLEDVSFSYLHMKHKKNYGIEENEDNMILRHVNFEAKPNETVGVIGINGVGKSTLLKLLVGIEEVSQGTIMIMNREMNQRNLAQIRQDVGYVFQDSDSQLFMSTVYDDVAFGPMNYGLNEDEVKAATLEALKKVKIEHLADKKIYQLSGGEKKLASIATVLSLNPTILLMDEPSVALDPQNRRNLIQVLNEIPMTKIIASHDLDFIYDTCDRTILLSEGSIVEDGDTKILLRNKNILEQYGLELPLSFSR